MLLNKDERKTIDLVMRLRAENLLTYDEGRAVLAGFGLVLGEKQAPVVPTSVRQVRIDGRDALKVWQRCRITTGIYQDATGMVVRVSAGDPIDGLSRVSGYDVLLDHRNEVDHFLALDVDPITQPTETAPQPEDPCTKLPAEAAPSTPQRRFEIGDHVIHEQWGEGVIRCYYKAYDADTAPWQVKFEDGHHWCVEERLEPVKQPTTGATVGDRVRDNNGDCGIIKAIDGNTAWVWYDDLGDYYSTELRDLTRL